MKNDDWIPVKKKKPDDDRVVLVTLLNPAIGRRYISFAWYNHRENRWMMYEKGVRVIAWQNRPDPYIEKE